jgi:hypothetical protein
MIQAGGCDEEVDEEDVEAGEVDQLAQRLTATVVQVSQEDARPDGAVAAPAQGLLFCAGLHN